MEQLNVNRQYDKGPLHHLPVHRWSMPQFVTMVTHIGWQALCDTELHVALCAHERRWQRCLCVELSRQLAKSSTGGTSNISLGVNPSTGLKNNCIKNIWSHLRLVASQSQGVWRLRAIHTNIHTIIEWQVNPRCLHLSRANEQPHHRWPSLRHILKNDLNGIRTLRMMVRASLKRKIYTYGVIDKSLFKKKKSL